MPELKGSKTEENLKAAFAGESQACVKYQYYASRAKRDGYERMAAIFEETSLNEKEHAKLWFKALNGGSVPPTPDNLQDAANGEHHEYSEMYPDFAKTAREEGFDEIADLFDMVAKIESQHEKRYLTLADRIAKDEVFKSEKTAIWHCRNCGHTHIGNNAPEECPTCAHPQSYFEINAENY
ncbi:rubrerythrin family protein [Candidatus Saccharibacteria bacterium]|nr:rubrerythrin family protein [Candidatus Saccharibacteria bacterium]